MRNRLWKWLVLTVCTGSSLACSHDSCHRNPHVALGPPDKCCGITGMCITTSAQPSAGVAKPTPTPTPVPTATPVPSDKPIVLPPVKPVTPPTPVKPGKLSAEVSKIQSVEPDLADEVSTAAGAMTPEEPGFEMPLPKVRRLFKPEINAAPNDPVTLDLPTEKSNAGNEAHASDYTWVVGRLEYLHMKNQWRVRYSSCEVDDPFGGTVRLCGIDHLSSRLKEGTTVRLEGQLINADGVRISPEYFVRSLKITDR